MEFLRWDTQPFLCGFNDPQVGLVGKHKIHVVLCQARLFNHGAYIVTHGVDCKFIDLLPIHKEVGFTILGFAKRRISLHVRNPKHVHIAGRRNADGAQAVPLAQHSRASPIAKQHAGPAVLPIEQLGHLLRGNQQDLLDALTGKIAGCNVQHINKAGTRGIDVERRASRPQPVLDNAGQSRRYVVAPNR